MTKSNYLKDTDISANDTIIGEFIVNKTFFFPDELNKIGDKFKISLAKVQDYSTIDNLKAKKPMGWVKLHSNEDFNFWVIYEIKELQKFGIVNITFKR